MLTLTPRHDCGMCDEPLRYVADEHGFHTWQCPACAWWHTSQDCCQNPVITVGDRIVLTKMEDPAPIPIGTFGTVEQHFFHGNDQSTPERHDQILINWDNGRSLMLAADRDTFELANHGLTYVIYEEPELV